jgi:hypothetical protein
VIFGPYGVGGGGWGGPPTVADFDGDGVPDFGLASSSSYYVYALKCAGNNKPPDCKGIDQGVLWQKPTHDLSSGGTGSSVFDFNGDGKAEVVYRDECWLRVYNGPDGKVVFAATQTSGTALEFPVIGDIDNDGHADIVVPADNEQGNGYCPAQPEADTQTPWTGINTGVYVYRDPMNRWMPSRGIWNQHAYHITNVNDDTTVPTVEKDNWLTWNNYRQNVQGMAGMSAPQPDFTGGQATGIDSGNADCDVAWTLKANLCNRGTAPVNAGIPGTFYSTDPRQGMGAVICTTMTTLPLKPGECETVVCDWKMPPQTPVDIWFRADDDGTGKMPAAECKPMNDTLYLPQVACMKIG